MVDELLDLVDENDKVIGTVWKREAHKDPSKIHREVAIVIINENGQLLLQRRSSNKKHHPGRWAITAGHVDSREKPYDAAVRELKEELGIVADLKFQNKLLLADNKEKRFFWTYKAEVRDGVLLKPNEEEIMDIVWIHYGELEEFSQKNDYNLNGSTHKILASVLK